MAQCKPISKPEMVTFGEIESRKKRLTKPLNDNGKTPLSGLQFREQKRRLKRASDLSWQIKFATMKLKHWHGLDNPSWAPLDKFHKAALRQQVELGPV